MEPLPVIGTVFVLLAGAVGSWFGGSFYARFLDFVQADLGDKLRRLRVPTTRLRSWLIAWTVTVVLVFVLVWTLLTAPVLGLCCSLLLLTTPWYIIRRLAEQRQQKIEDQLADAMVSLAGAIKAGLSLGQSLQILAEQCPNPIRQEFMQIVNEYNLGKPIERCLEEAKARLKSENFALFAAAMDASRQSGGRLNETVERIATSVLELQRLERKILSETAQARASALYMALAPIAILIMYYLFIDPENTERLFTTLPGQIMLSISLVLNVVAYLWARKILAPDI
jgi:tight adherence protein B